MSALIRRVPRLALAGGVLVFGLGLWGALRVLPEWRAPLSRDRQALQAARQALASASGGKVTGARFTNATADSESSVEAAYRHRGTGGRDWLVSSGVAGGQRMLGHLHVPDAGAGPFEAHLGADGTIRKVAWMPGGSLFSFVRGESEAGRAIEKLLDDLSLFIADGRPLEKTRSELRPLGGSYVRVTPLGGTEEAILRTGPPSPLVAVDRRLLDPESARRLSPGSIYQKLLWRQMPLLLFGAAVLVLFAVRLFRGRVGMRIASQLTALATVSMLIGAATPSDLSGGFTGLLFIGVGRVIQLTFLLILWATAESLLRDTVPGFTTSLDAFATGRLGPRGGRAVLGGLGLGAAIAGLRLGVLSLAAARLAPEVRPTELSFRTPILAGGGSPFFEGPFHAAILVFLVALLRFVLPRGWAESAAAALFALFLSLSAPLAPWGAGLALSLATAILAIVSFRRFGLAALLVTTTAAPLLRDVAASARMASVAPLPFAFCAAAAAALVVVGLVALSRHEREDEGRIDAPEYVKRVENERRVKYEMDLLSRMQLAMLPDHPPAVPGLDMAVRTVLATEAGGDLYEFIEEEGELWVAAGDVSGHGYSCGIQGAMVKAALLSLAKKGRAPGEVLCEIDRVLRAAKAGRLFTSLALLKLDPKTGKGSLANAGHPFPLLVTNGACVEITGSGLPLGQGPHRRYEEIAVDLPEGGSLVFASDGLYEGPDRFDEPYGYERPRAVLEGIGLWRRPAEAIVEALFADWRNHVGEEAPADDTTVLVVKRPTLAW